MDLILCHTTADFDTLGAAIGLSRLHSGAKVVLTGGSHPGVRDFLALHRDEYALIERRAVNPEQIRSLTVVDTQYRDRIGKASEWLNLPQLTEIVVYDHHPDVQTDIPATRTQIELVGATTTLIAELLQREEIQLTPAEATVMALGIHVDTGSLTFDGSTPRDAIALAWLMQQGASLSVVADYIEPGLSPQLQELLTVAIDSLESDTVQGYKVSWVLLKSDGFVPGLSSLASRLLDLTESDALLLGNIYSVGDGDGGTWGWGDLGMGGLGDRENLANEQLLISNPKSKIQNPKLEGRLTVIGRSRIEGTNLNELFKPLGGGGHFQAASLTLRGINSEETLAQLVKQLIAQIPQPPTARELMSSPVRTIRPETTINQAQRTLLRYGHSGLCVVEAEDENESAPHKIPLVGVISRRDIDLALHHGFSHAPVKGYMTTNVKTITPDTLLPEIESLMVTYDIGRLPVLENNQLVGIVTRTDVLRQLHQQMSTGNEGEGVRYCPLPRSLDQLLRDRLASPLWELLTKAEQLAQQRGWHLYLVGGAVRDLLLADTANSLMIEDIDLVVDGFHRSADVGAGVELARELQQIYPAARLEVHGQFQTAALLWHKDPVLGSLWVDIATARTEFYPYPAANPEVEASSIRQDLYRRDFTINALAVRLTSPRTGELLDFFGGLLDLQAKQIRVLHPNSFIEDPTRIYRAVRFAVRLGFNLEPQTQGYIRNALASGICDRHTGLGDGEMGGWGDGEMKGQGRKFPLKTENSKLPQSKIQNPKSKIQTRRVPALETRLKSELKYILQAPYWKPALKLLADLGALRCIHPTLELEPQLWWQICLVDRCLRRFDLEKNFEHWLIRLEVLIAYLAPEYRGQVAQVLQLSDNSIKRLQQLDRNQTAVANLLQFSTPPSEIVRSLRQYDLPMLILIAAKNPRSHRQKIWQYLTQWANIKAPLNGDDLKALGYKPGRHYKEILDALLAATLDGEISINKAISQEEIRAEAEAFIKEHFSYE